MDANDSLPRTGAPRSDDLLPAQPRSEQTGCVDSPNARASLKAHQRRVVAPRWAKWLFLVVTALAGAAAALVAYGLGVTWFVSGEGWQAGSTAGWEWEMAGQAGDLFGGLTASVSALSFLGVVLALFMQRDELREQRKALRLQTEELKLARDEAARQADAMEDQSTHLHAMQKSAVRQAEALSEQAAALAHSRQHAQATMLTVSVKTTGAGWGFWVKNHGNVAINVRAWVVVPSDHEGRGRFYGPVLLPNAVLPAGVEPRQLISHLPWPRLSPGSHVTVIVVLGWVSASAGVQSASFVFSARGPVKPAGQPVGGAYNLLLRGIGPRAHKNPKDLDARERGRKSLEVSGLDSDWLRTRKMEPLK